MGEGQDKEFVIGPNQERLGPGRSSLLTIRREGDRARFTITSTMDGRPLILAVAYLDRVYALALRDALSRWFEFEEDGDA